MPFTPWNEAVPAGSDAPSTLDNVIRDLKVQTRERLATVFPDWNTATDRITMQKLFTHSSDLTIRDSTDTYDIAKIYNAGGMAINKPFVTGLFTAGAIGSISTAQIVTGSPTEIIDPHNWHTSNWRITVPAGMGGTFWVTLAFAVVNSISAGGVTQGLRLYKNGIATTEYDVYTTRSAISKVIHAFGRFPIALNATDYIEPWFAGDLNANDQWTKIYFCLEKIN